MLGQLPRGSTIPSSIDGELINIMKKKSESKLIKQNFSMSSRLITDSKTLSMSHNAYGSSLWNADSRCTGLLTYCPRSLNTENYTSMEKLQWNEYISIRKNWHTAKRIESDKFYTAGTFGIGGAGDGSVEDGLSAVSGVSVEGAPFVT